MDKLQQYLENNSSAGTVAENALLAELDRATNIRVVQPKMVSGRVQGAFLTLMTRILRPRLVLEIGTFTGYSALSIAAGLDRDAEIHTVEIDDELEDIARSFFERSPHGCKVRPHIGSALEIVPRLSQELGRPFDMIFIDGDKREYPDYYRMLTGNYHAACDPACDTGTSGGGITQPMVRSGTVILADNVLWYGKVVETEISRSDRHTVGIVEFNRMVAADSRVENVITPLRDGINLIRVK